VYGRIALGYILLIALELAAQGAVFLWLVERQAQPSTPDVTQGLASQLAQALQAAPDANLDAQVSQLRRGEHVFAIMNDGRVSGARTPSAATVRDVIAYLKRPEANDRMPETWAHSEYNAAPLMVGGRLVGVLGIVPPTTLEQFGPVMTAIGLVLLLVGTLVSSVLIFRPVRSRIQDLQRAADLLRSGDLTARAREDGADEVADLAHAFNAMADELGQRAAALEGADRRRRQLIADVSHELMTPLTAVLGHLETLTMAEVRLNDEQRLHQVTITTREAKRLERLIGDLLDAARLEAGGGDLDVQHVATRELFDQVMAHHESDCRAGNIRIVASIAPDAQMLYADPFRLEQAIENVITNAIRHTPDGGLVELKAETADGKVVLTVSDSGVGIAPEHLPLIFDRFYKTSSAKGIAARGSGLGLSIVKAIVTRHGGRVSATSVLGAGTTIRIELPVRVEHAADAVAQPA
jgi:signal transduction histidine kinase